MYKEFLEIVGSGKPTGSVPKETLAISGTINKRAKLTQPNPPPRSFFYATECEKCVENPKSQGRSPSGRMYRWPARITSKELAPIHSVKSDTLQNACSTRPRVVADLVKGARMHIVRLMINLVKSPKRMMTKVQQPC